MPVEDIDFLLKNNSPDSYLFFVDSGVRNTTAFPSSSEYEVVFSEPFFNVFGLELMDGMVPSTMYTIDKENDVFAYYLAFLKPNLGDEVMYRHVQDMYQHVMLRGLIKPSMGGRLSSSTSTLLVIDKELLQLSNYTITELNTPASQYYACLHSKFIISGADVQIIPTELEIDTSLLLSVFDSAGVRYSINRSNPILADCESYLISGNFAIHLQEASGDLWVNVYDVMPISTDTYDDLAETRQIGAQVHYTYNFVLFTWLNRYCKLEPGNYDITEFQTYLTSVFSTNVKYNVTTDTTDRSFPFLDVPNDVPIVTQTSKFGTITKQSKYKFIYRTANSRFFLNLSATTCTSAIGFPSYKTRKEATVNDALYTIDTNWPMISDIIVASVPQSDGSYIVVPPGIVNLSGTRYVILRCPEVESHLYNSFSYAKNCPGIALLKLGSINSIANVRLDFVNFVKKPFHPIGKLSKLTFRFEQTDGSLYDFKGVDHNLLIAVKFYVPRLNAAAASDSKTYPLNPNYNPNFIEYVVNKLGSEAKELDERKMVYKNFLQEQNAYDYSSDEEASYDGEDNEVNLMFRRQNNY